MRLTLRTMLAYMDGNLEPDDAAEIGKKIEESEFAKNLLQRVRDVMKRLRLAAPSVSDRGPGLDPNTVAEYLDNTLAGDRVPDFEKVCLDSDVQLAEVASCHQILTLVLGEPAEVEPASRQRMYQVPEEAEKAAPPPSSPVPPPLLPEAPPVKVESPRRGRKSAVPDYLREPSAKAGKRWRLLPAILTVAGLLALAAGALALTGQLQPGSRLVTMLGFGPAAAKVSDAKAGASKTAAAAAGVAAPAENVPAAKPPAATAAAPASVADKGAPAAGADKSGMVGPAIGGPAGPAGSGLTAAVPVPGAPAPLPAPPGSGELARLEPKPMPAVSGAGTAPAGKGPDVAATPDTSKPAAGASKTAVPPPKPGPPENASGEVAPLPPERLGRFLSEREVLLQYDPNLPGWNRVQQQAMVTTGVPYLAIPSFRPTITLTVGATVVLAGGTRLELLPADATGTAGLSVAYGRLILRPVGDTKVHLRLQIGRRQGRVSFRSAESIIALVVDRARAVGANPETESGPLRCEIFSPSGDFTWEEAGSAGQVLSVPAASSIVINDQPLQGPLPVPDLAKWKWVMGEEMGLLDRRAQPTIEAALREPRPASLVMRELVDHRQSEVQSLAIRCLAYTGNFEPLVALLNSAEQRTWDKPIAELQNALARGPEVAVEVRQALEKRYPPEAAALYRMLWGYTDRDVEQVLNTVVPRLDSELLACRVLAHFDLERLTGAKFAFKPQDPPQKRQMAMAKFRERLQSGGIVHAEEKRAAAVEGTSAGQPQPAASKGAPPPPLPSPPGDK